MRPLLFAFGILLSIVAGSGLVQAQWSIGAAGDRSAPEDLNRYLFLAMSNPLPGHEREFDEWYDMHQGDMGLVRYWEGSQRFRIERAANADTAEFGFVHLTMYDLISPDPKTPVEEGVKSFMGGRTRIFEHQNTEPGQELAIVYQALTARIPRPDGKGNTVPAVDDYTHPRTDRFLLAEWLTPQDGVGNAEMEVRLEARMRQVLSVDGFNAAQLYRHVPVVDIENFPDLVQALPLYLTLWEVEADSAGEAQAALDAAETSGAVARLPIAREQSKLVFWRPIRPYVTRDMFAR